MTSYYLSSIRIGRMRIRQRAVPFLNGRADGSDRACAVSGSVTAKSGAALAWIGNCHASVVGDDDLLDQCQAQAGPSRFGRKERPENPGSDGRIDTRAVVRRRRSAAPVGRVDVSFDKDYRRIPPIDTGLKGVSTQIAERLAQEHFVALDRCRMRRAPRPVRRARSPRL